MQLVRKVLATLSFPAALLFWMTRPKTNKKLSTETGKPIPTPEPMSTSNAAHLATRHISVAIDPARRAPRIDRITAGRATAVVATVKS